MFKIVEFKPQATDDLPTCDIVHDSWLVNDGDGLFSFFPPFRNPAGVAKAVKCAEVPNEKWTKTNCSIVKSFSKCYLYLFLY